MRYTIDGNEVFEDNIMVATIKYRYKHGKSIVSINGIRDITIERSGKNLMAYEDDEKIEINNDMSFNYKNSLFKAFFDNNPGAGIEILKNGKHAGTISYDDTIYMEIEDDNDLSPCMILMLASNIYENGLDFTRLIGILFYFIGLILLYILPKYIGILYTALIFIAVVVSGFLISLLIYKKRKNNI
ncbi:vitamin K epoxide reductase family protein [Picrophilus oshimae]|uniref:Uncharacterized protein n=1 Tax=Picrophilus torridus (strain ATCC 700027 / DSM 9790 / JCM 10055 / NBRC 100828 / KAW 2/3) TaxID=1122961 RepID=A0A8G2L7U4_PICTO|nr:vitamin K epoxide reductase family protein [Picrophilus oshimae]SMD30660.1 hypothetical protein SAMN02745355_0553 [Picrophilus oshimae DSM 9789]